MPGVSPSTTTNDRNMTELKQTKRRIPWHRTRIDRALLADLNRRSDFWGLVQTLGYLGTLIATGAIAWWASLHLEWYWFTLALFVHGTGCAFMINGFHELCHSSVFRSQWLNVFFLYVLSFLGWLNPVHFWASHAEHHKYTLYPPEDGEVVFPFQMTVNGYLKSAFIDPQGHYNRIRGTFRRGVMGRVDPGWNSLLFPAENVDGRRRLFRWDRVLLSGHAALIAGSLYVGWWQLPVLITFAPLYGRWLFLLCNSSQHIGLTDEVPDFRLNSRTILLNPVVQFLYWHMNYHIEHHMFAAVPCYKLGRLHRAIRHDLPQCPDGLLETYRQISAIVKRQKEDPDFQFQPELPPAAGE
jgi:fatty acid desaturase